MSASSRPTLRQVALAAGVSVMTVSRALRGQPGVAPAVRERVRRAAAEVGYRPDPELAKLMHHLRTGRARGYRSTLCAVTDTPARREPPYCVQLRERARQRAEELGFGFTVLRVGTSGTRDWPALTRTLRARGVEGVLLLPMLLPVDLGGLEWAGFSVVAATSSVTAPVFHRAAPHHLLNAHLMVRELARSGSRRIGLVCTETHALRTLHAFPSALAWHHAQARVTCPPLIYQGESPVELEAWVRRERPEVVVATRERDLPGLRARLARAGSAEVPLVLSSVESEPAPCAGIDERQDRVGAAAVDLLAGLIARGEHGVPAAPAMMLLPGEWREPGG